MVHTELDQPDEVVVPCKLCGEPLRARFHLVLGRRLRPTIHDHCVPLYEKRLEGAPVGTERDIPPRFQNFDPHLFTDKEALAIAQTFSPQSDQHILAILGPPAKGKSRLAWAVAIQFFDELCETTGSRRWIDCYVGFESAIAEFDKFLINRMATARFVFADDFGSVDSYGSVRGQLQAAIRSRIKNNRWMILTIDDLSFDLEIPNILKDRALVVHSQL
jgi:hypothetical protein